MIYPYKVYTYAILIATTVTTYAFAQASQTSAVAGHRLDADFVAENVADIRVTKKGFNWLTLRAERRLSPNNFFTQHHRSFRLGPEDAMQLMKSTEDALGMTHYRYQQTYKGIKVEGAEMLVHARDGHAVRINGGIVTGLSLKISPEISERLALDSALSAVSAGVYRWESPAWEARIKEFKNDPNATYYPQAELVIAQSSGQRDMLPDNYRLAYKFAIYSSVPSAGGPLRR